MDVRFSVTRFSEGYDMQEVDDFLDRCDRALATGDGSVTAQSVREMRFSPTRFREAYRMDEVDDFLDSVLAQRFVSLEAAEPQPGDFAEEPGDSAEGMAVPAPAPVPTPEPRASSATAPHAAGADGDFSGGRGIHPAESRPGFLQRLFGGGR